MKTSWSRYDTLTVDELHTVLNDLEHEHLYVPIDDVVSSDYYHDEINCEVCYVENLASSAEHLAASLLPGNLPRLSCPSVYSGTMSSVFAREVQVGYFASYIARPGSGDYPADWVECVAVDYIGDFVRLSWRRTNDETAESFSAVYEPAETVSVAYRTFHSAPEKVI